MKVKVKLVPEMLKLALALFVVAVVVAEPDVLLLEVIADEDDDRVDPVETTDPVELLP